MTPASVVPGRVPSREDLLRNLYLTLKLEDEHEPSMPTDGSAYLSHRYFSPSSLAEARGHWKRTLRLMREGKAPRELGLFLHWPFCISQCTFCFCNLKVPEGGREMADYRALVETELEAFRDIFEGTPFTSIYIGGGTPSFMSEAELDSLFRAIRSRYALAPDPEIYFEASPATLTEGKVERLLANGVNHVTLGVQSMDEAVLKRVDRKGQTREGVERAFRMLAASGRILVGIDLMIGLEGQSDLSFLSDFARFLGALKPHNIRAYAFDPRPQTLYALSGKRAAASKWTRHLRIMNKLDQLAEAAGYVPTPVDPREALCLNTITRQCREARLSGASVLAVGSGGISHAFGSAWYEHPAFWKAKELEDGLLPFHGIATDMEDERRGFAMRQLSSWGRMSVPGYRAVFGEHPAESPGLGAALRELEAWGKLRLGREEIEITSPDKLEWLVYSKHLYSPRLVDAILADRREDFEAFAKGGAPRQGDWKPWLERKRVPALMRMYYHPTLPRPRGTL